MQKKTLFFPCDSGLFRLGIYKMSVKAEEGFVKTI